MPSDGYENEISMKFAVNRHWKKVARYEETFFEGMEKNSQGYEKNFKGVKF